MEATLEKRIVNLEQQFLLAVLSNDEEALEEFSREQSQFSNHIKALKASRALDDKTALLTSYLAGSIENVANCPLHVEAIFQDAQYHLNDLIREIPPNTHETLSHFPPIKPYHLLFSHHPSPVQTTLGQNNSLDAYAYRWLMQNLHNPYPTSMQFQVLGDLSGTSVAQVELWFEEMRDAIGWTKLSHECFASSPSATVAAARRVYLERDKDVPFDVVFAFTAVKASAETHFLEHPALQEKYFNEEDDLSWTLPGIPEAQSRYMDSEGIFVPFAADSSIPSDDFPYLSDGDESEEEDTTPPPAVAGCKRRLTEDVVTSEDSNLARPPKKHRIRAEIEGTLSNQECAPPALSNSDPLLECNGTQDTEPTSVDMSPTHTSSDSSLHPISSSHSYATFICHKRGRAELDEDPSDNFVSRNDVPPRPIQRRKVMESASPVPSGQVCSSPVGPGNHPPLGPSPPSEQPSSPPFPHSIVVPVFVGADVSNPGIIDCDSIPSPQKDVAWIPTPACITVSNSDFLGSNPQLPHVPGLEYHFTAGSSSSYLLGNPPSFGELSYLSSSPTSSSSCASLYSETPSTSQVFDWSNLTEFIDPVFLTQSQSSSQISLPTPPSTLPNSQEDSLLAPILPSYGINRLGSLLDPSIPPSALLPMQPDASAEDINLWPLYEVL